MIRDWLEGRKRQRNRHRPLIWFFDYPDVFEDFYPRLKLDQNSFATRWADTGSHAFLKLMQDCIGDVVWISFSLSPKLDEARHQTLGFRVKFVRSSLLHRWLWKWFYATRFSWRWQRYYTAYAWAASYLCSLSYSALRAFLRERPDFFFVQDYANGRFDQLVALSKLLGVRLVATHAGSVPERYVGKLVKRWSIPSADCLIASSQRELRLLRERFGVPAGRAPVILTPIDTVAHRPIPREDAIAGLDIVPDRRYLLYIGRLDEEKRVGHLIKSFARLLERFPTVDLLIVGDGRDGPQLRELAAEMAGDRIRFLGWISEVETKVRLLNVAECLVLPSRREGFPTVVGEAMSCGTPMVASDVGGVSELVIEGITGYLCPAMEDDGLAERLSEVLRDPKGMARMRAKARELAEQRVSPAAVSDALRACFFPDSAI